MLFNKKSIGSIVILIGSVILVGGLPVWIIGSQRPSFYTSKLLISLPLYPKTDDKLSYWTLKNISQKTNSENEKISFTIDSFFLGDSLRKMSFYFLHNMHGIESNISIYNNKNVKVCSIYKNFNSVIGKTNNNSISYFPIGSYPDELSNNGYYRVYCPFDTLITDKNQISKTCKQAGGGYMKVKDELAATFLCNINLKDTGVPLKVVVDNFTAITKDFIHTPQIFMVMWKKTDSFLLTLIGSIITSIGMLVFIAALIVFISMLFDEQV